MRPPILDPGRLAPSMPLAIILTKGYVALVDEEDYDYLSQFTWHADVRKVSGDRALVYARRMPSRKLGKRSPIYMHAEICGYPDADHQDGDGLNNQRYNLRPASESQNRANSRRRVGTTSIYRGVSWNKRDSKWRASIRKDKKTFNLGNFFSEADAAQVYNFAAESMHGEFARLNHA